MLYLRRLGIIGGDVCYICSRILSVTALKYKPKSERDVGRQRRRLVLEYNKQASNPWSEEKETSDFPVTLNTLLSRCHSSCKPAFKTIYK